jgi:hypothetical protein
MFLIWRSVPLQLFHSWQLDVIAQTCPILGKFIMIFLILGTNKGNHTHRVLTSVCVPTTGNDYL